MYTPTHNRETDLPTLRDFIRSNPLCALVTQTPAGLLASHLPVVLHESAAGPGTLRAHVALANTQWQHLDNTEALAIFTGPQHYISASWYPGKQTHGREVPTWNYVAVHAYGQLRAITDPAWLLDHLRSLTESNEHIAEIPWHVDDAPPAFIEKLSKAIVGLELDITRLEGKWKASQNRSDTDAAAVASALEALNTPQAATMQHLIESRRPRS